ncbi:hypothetical protein GCM10028796_16970 [Ramlibacter monticola]|uniref:Uncharacterized protein n=1 Tax=Ramlibacter monticola TaxID=1926872 RepID=A0A936YXS7_9BURK|nr:hypothetical protein [Ramlibacter monticola]MBL0390524.1 hypothetical protein [Ramlibacter monticola]
MPLTAPPSAPPASPTAPGDAPSRVNPSSFRSLADAFVVWLVGFRNSVSDLRAWLATYITWAGTHVTEMNALQTDVSTKSAQVATDAAQVAADAVTVAGIASAFGDVDTAIFDATTQAGIATSQAVDAAAQATTATAAKVAAEAARDAANTSGRVYASTAAGLAGTTNGQTFSVFSGDYIIQYRNDSGSATEVGRFYVKSFFDALFPQGFGSARTGWLHAWQDSAGRLLGGIKLDGTFWSKGVNISGGVTQALADAAAALTAGQGAAIAAATVLAGPERSLYLHAFTDSASRILGGFLKNGELEVKGVNISQAVEGVPTAISYTQPSTDSVIFGDSLTEGAGASAGQSVGEQLQALYVAAADTRTIYKSGYGGQSSSSILARLGPVPSLVTLPTGASGFPEIPASGSVNVTVTKAPLAYADASQTKSITGTLAGIPGTLSKAGVTGQYSFARTAAGSIVVCDSAIPFVPATEAHRFHTLVCWIGTNNMLSNTAAEILAYIGQYLSWQATTQKRRVVVMPAIDCLSGSVATIKATYDSLLALVKEAYPYEYIDLRGLLQRHNDGSGNDLADIAAGLPPRSLLHTDRYHLNTAGYGVVAAEIKRIFDSKGF